MHNRVAVVIDDPNTKAALANLGIKLDYGSFLKSICGLTIEEIEIKNLFYDSYEIPDPNGVNSFLATMLKLGFEIIDVPKKLYHYQAQTNGRTRKSRTDQMITVYLMEFLHENLFDTLIFFSGDSDFEFVLDIIKAHRKKIIIVSSRASLSAELSDLGTIILLDDLVETVFTYPASPKIVWNESQGHAV